MMPAAKMMDPVLGIDIHMIQPPGPVPPVPIPHPFVGMLFDPMDLVPFVGATVLINGMPRGIAGTAAKALPPHIPMGGAFVPPPPGNEGEMFMGSATVTMDGDPASYLALPALSCQTIGMPAPFRLNPKKKTKMKSLQLPTSVVLPIPMGLPVLVGGPPTISLMGMLQKLGMAALGKAMKKLKKMMKASKKMQRLSKKLHNAAKKAMTKLGVPPSIQNKVHKAICTVTGHPVDVATGKVFTDNVDFELPGPIPFKWERTWYSCSTYLGPLGHGWHHSYDLALVEDEKAVAVRMADGRPAAFPKLKQGESFYLRSEKATLLRDEQGYALRTKDKRIYRFAGKPSQHGVFPLAELSDASGNRIRFAYNAQGHLKAIQDSANRLIKFITNKDGQILEILLPHPDDREQHFSALTYRYDEKGDLVEAIDALGYPWRYTYSSHLLTKEINRNGLTFQFAYESKQASARCVRTWGDDGIYDHKLAYDIKNRATTVENSLGHKSIYYWSETGLVLQVKDARGNNTSISYNAFNEPESETDEIGQVTRYSYDDRGNCARIDRPGGHAVEIHYQEDNPILALDAIGGSWTWEYDVRNRPVKRTDPLGQVTEFRYEGSRLIALRNPAGGETQFRYGPIGELTSLITPKGAECRWTYDLLGRCHAFTDVRGNSHRRVFDLIGRLRKVEGPDGIVRELDYNPEGQVIRVRDRLHDIAFQYQGMGRLACRIERGIKVTFRYDTEERLIGIQNEHGLVYAFERDAAGSVIAETGLDGLRRTYRRDAKGRVTLVDRPGGIWTELNYDAADRVEQILHSTGERETYAYRVDGELQEASNAERKVAFQRDALGRVLIESQDDHIVESIYGPHGLRVEIKSSQGARLNVKRNISGEAIQVVSGSDGDTQAWEARFLRDEVGLELERTLTGGVKSRWIRDNVGRPLRHNLVTPLKFRSREYTWDTGLRLKSIRDSRLGISTFEYDPLDNLIWSENPDGTYLFRMPDAVGNLFRSPEKNDRSYGPAGQLLETRGPKGTTRYEYDAEGNLVRKIRPDGKVWSYRWNASGMLVSVMRPDGLEVTFGYDALGRRIRKAFQGRTVRWTWDGNTPLHEWVDESNHFAATKISGSGNDDISEQVANRRKAESKLHPAIGPPGSETGTISDPVTWLFEPESYSPMAKVVGGKHYSIVSDHRGVPLAMFDSGGQEKWSAQIDIYGQLTVLAGEKTACPFRFPGQYEDTETGLYYNRHRYYDPDSGIYCSQDPIGLAGGTRPYAYVPDPLVWHDPLGLNGDCTPSLKKGDPLPEDAVIHRIGGGSVENLGLKPPEKKLAPPGISVLRAESAEAASQMAKDVAKEKGWGRMEKSAETMGSAKVGEIRAAGFDVIHDPTPTWGDAHARLIHPEGEKGFTPENLDKLSKVFENKSGL